MTVDPFKLPGDGIGTDKLREYIRLIKLLFLVVAFVFLACVVWSARAALTDLVSRADPASLGFAVLFGVAAHAFAPVCSVAALKLAGTGFRYHSALQIHIRNLPARYLPGGVWHTVGRAHDFLAAGMRKSDLAVLLVLESALPVGVGLAISGSLMLWISDAGSQRQTIASTAVVVGLLILLLLPIAIGRVTKASIQHISSVHYLKLLGIYVTAWLLLAGMFTCYIKAFGISGDDWGGLLYLCAAYIFAWSVGFIAFFAPQGVGIFEVTAASLLSDKADLTIMIALVAGFRLVPIATDLIVWAAYWSIAMLYRLIQALKQRGDF